MADGRRHLILVGLMGAGKSTVGRRCADRLGRAFIDTDVLVEQAAATGIPDIFAAEGEAGFRARERQAVADACATPAPAVIACGGGAVLDPDNRARLREAGVVIWLEAAPAVLASRVDGDSGRPLLTGGDPEAVLGRQLELRRPAYEAAADARVDTGALDAEAATEAVLGVLAGRG